MSILDFIFSFRRLLLVVSCMFVVSLGQRADAAPRPPKTKRGLAKQIQRWMQTTPTTRAPKTTRVKRKRRLVAQDDLVPDIEPVGPLPSVYRKVRLTSEPSGIQVTIRAGKRIFPCLPGNRTPCIFEVTGRGKMTLEILARFGTRTLRYPRPVEGSSSEVDGWKIKAKADALAMTVLRPKKIGRSGGALRWVLIGGGIVVAGVAIGVIAGVLLTKDNLSFKHLR